MLSIVFFAALALVIPVYSQVNGTAEIEQSIALLQASGNFTTLLSLLSNPLYASPLNLTDGSDKTLFAPTDAAFTAAASAVNLTAILENSAIVTAVLAYHIVPAYFPSDVVITALENSNPTTAQTLEGSSLSLFQEDSTITVNNATVVQIDIQMSGATSIHAIDGVLIPPSVIALLSGVNGTQEINSAVAALQQAGNYSTLLTLLSNPDYATALNLTDGKNKTLFAPTDDAFAAVDGATVELVLANVTLLIGVLSHHIVPAYYPAETVLSVLQSSPASLPTLEGTVVNASLDGESINLVSSSSLSAMVVSPDIFASGVTAIHGINGVLVPAEVAEALSSAVSPSAAPAPAPGGVDGEEEVATVIAGLSGSERNYSVLLGLLETYGADLNLADGSDKTLFAPSNEAFAALPSDVSALLTDSTIVIQVLSYHSVPAYLPASSILEALAASANSTSVSTTLGQDLNVTLSSDGLKVNNSTVIETDIVASGVTAVHGIDAVLIPNLSSGEAPAMSPPPVAATPSPPPPPSSAFAPALSLLAVAIGMLSFLVVA